MRGGQDLPSLFLRPASARGWFGGDTLQASEPCEVLADVSLTRAAEVLEAQFEGVVDSAVTAVLAAYEGRCTVVRFASSSARPLALPGPLAPARSLLEDAEYDLSPHGFRSAVRETRERIAAGDVYVLNLTARLEGRLAAACPEEAFATLVARAGADMGALLTGLPGPTPWIASASPERFLSVRREGRGRGAPRVVAIEPVKGTRPRGSTSAADAALGAGLLADPKERAEHVMVVDLERNDLGISCEAGSVRVDPLYELVTTPYCHQLVSRVLGDLRPDASFAELLEGVFPCGSVTGAPKRAAVRIADGLEATPRGAYCGSLLVAVPGALDSSVLIRTLEGVRTKEEDASLPSARARLGVGCGITYESDPAAEYVEALLKASPVTGDGGPPVALRETMRVEGGCVPLLDHHLARLAAGGAGPTTLARAREAVAREVAGASASSGAKAPGVSGHGRGRGCARLTLTVEPEGAMEARYSTVPSSLDVPGGPVSAPVEVGAVPPLPPGAAKPADRRLWDEAHASASRSGAHQAALHTADGVLVDGSTATLWLVSEGRLATPPAPPAVAGVARGLVFELAARRAIPCVERRLTLAEFEEADEVFLSNAYGGIAPVRGRSGPVSEALVADLAEEYASGAIHRAAGPVGP